jgi:hypothetical protein
MIERHALHTLGHYILTSLLLITLRYLSQTQTRARTMVAPETAPPHLCQNAQNRVYYPFLNWESGVLARTRCHYILTPLYHYPYSSSYILYRFIIRYTLILRICYFCRPECGVSRGRRGAALVQRQAPPRWLDLCTTSALDEYCTRTRMPPWGPR